MSTHAHGGRITPHLSAPSVGGPADSCGFCRKFEFSEQNPKIGYQKFNSLQTPKLSKKYICDRTFLPPMVAHIYERLSCRINPFRADYQEKPPTIPLCAETNDSRSLARRTTTISMGGPT